MASVTRRPRLPTLADYYQLVWSRIALIVSLVVLGGLVGVGIAVTAPARYEAQVAIELPVRPTWIDVDPAPPSPQRITIDSTAQLVTAAPVLAAVAEATGVTPETAQRMLSVSAYPLTGVLIITYEAASREQATAGAQRAAESVIALRDDYLLGGQPEAVVAATNQLIALSAEAESLGGIGASLRGRIQTRITLLQERLRSATASEARIVEGRAPARPAGGDPEVPIVTGLTLGLFAGVLVAWLAPARRPRGDGINADCADHADHADNADSAVTAGAATTPSTVRRRRRNA